MSSFREFDGPLDLLIDEVRRQKVAIEKVAMAPIVARYLDYMRAAAEKNLKLDMDWLHTAATLIHWKSKSMLAAEASKDATGDPVREALVSQLLAHRKEAAGELARRKSAEESSFSRATKSPEPAAEETEEAGIVTVWDMLQQVRELVRWTEKHRAEHVEWRDSFGVERDEITVAASVEYLQQRLQAQPGSLDGLAMLRDEPSPERRACLFLAMLELSRDQRLILEQEDAFGPVWLQYIDMTTVVINK